MAAFSHRARALARLARASKACRAFATHEDVWKAATLTVHGGRFRWCSSGRWVDVFARTQRRGKKRGREEEEEEAGRGVVIQTPIFSDALHQRYMCAAMSLEDAWVDDAPSTVPEETAAALSVEALRHGAALFSSVVSSARKAAAGRGRSRGLSSRGRRCFRWIEPRQATRLAQEAMRTSSAAAREPREWIWEPLLNKSGEAIGTGSRRRRSCATVLSWIVACGGKHPASTCTRVQARATRQTQRCD